MFYNIGTRLWRSYLNRPCLEKKKLFKKTQLQTVPRGKWSVVTLMTKI